MVVSSSRRRDGGPNSRNIFSLVSPDLQVILDRLVDNWFTKDDIHGRCTVMRVGVSIISSKYLIHALAQRVQILPQLEMSTSSS